MADYGSIALDVVKLALPSALVIAGWGKVNSLTVARERDKSRREIIAKAVDDLCAIVDKLFEQASEYHSGDRNKRLEVKIKITLNDFSHRVASLIQLMPDNNPLEMCLTTLIKLRQAISGTHFEDEHDGPITEGGVHEGIADTTLAMKRCLFELKYSQFSLQEKIAQQR